MSKENVEIVRRAWEAYDRRDNEAALALYDPEIEVDLTASGQPGAGVYRGLEGVRRWLGDWHAAFAEISGEVHEWIDADDHVIAVIRWHGQGRLSGVPAQLDQAHVWQLRDGKLWRLRIYDSKAEALEAAGVPGLADGSPKS
jgi:ketosteroid isomerase-like protein